MVHVGNDRIAVPTRSGVVGDSRWAVVPPGSFVVLSELFDPSTLEAIESLRDDLELRLDGSTRKLSASERSRLCKYPAWGDRMFDVLVTTEEFV